MKETITKLKRQPSAWEEIITNEARLYNGAKTASSINGAGKTGQPLVKE